MIDYGKQRSRIKPKKTEMTRTKVFVASNIVQVSENVGEENEFNGYEFNWIEYEKDEYIKMISEKNESLEKEITNTQIALCEIYESMEV